MSAITSHRAALREGRMQQRIKARLEAWWHTKHHEAAYRSKIDLLEAIGKMKTEAMADIERTLN